MENSVALKRRRRHTTKAGRKEEFVGTLLASIPLIGFIIFGLIPLVIAFAMAFYEIDGYEIFSGEFVAFQNFKDVFKDPTFYEALRNTIRLGVSVLISHLCRIDRPPAGRQKAGSHCLAGNRHSGPAQFRRSARTVLS